MAGFYVLLTLVFFKPTVLDGQTFSTVGAVQRVYLPWQVTHPNDRQFFPQSDQAQSFYPRQVFIDRAIGEGRLPAWDPYTFGGHPYLSNGGNSFFYPPRQVLTRVADPALTHDLFLMFHMAAAGCSAFFLLRELRFSSAGSLLGGLAWMWNPFALAWMQLELLPPIVAWFPLAVALGHRAHERRSWPWRLTSGGACGLMLLGGSLDLALAATGVVALYAASLEAGDLLRTRRVPRFATRALAGLVRVAAVPATAVAVGAPAVAPFVLLSPRLARAPMDYDIFVDYVAVPLESFARIWWRPPYPITVPIMHSLTFVGTPIALLALIGVFQRRVGTGLARGMLAGSVLVLGRTPLVALYDQLSPSYRSLSLGRFMFAWCLGLAILAVAGFDRLLSAISGWHDRNATRPAVSVPDPIELGSLRAWRRHARGSATVVLFSVLLLASATQLFRYARNVNVAFTPRDRAWLYPETPVIEELLERQTGPAADRNLPIARPNRQPLPDASIPLVFPFESAAGYDSALPSTVAGMWRVLMGETPDQVAAQGLASGLVTSFRTDRTRFDLLPRLGITSVLAPNDLEDEPGWDEEGRAARGLTTVYDGPDADLLTVDDPAPRAYLVHHAEVETSPAQALERFTDPTFPWRTTVLLDRAAGTSTSSNSDEPLIPAEVTGHDLTEVRVEVDADAPGYLVLLDSYDAGWAATVDGEPTEVRRANSAFRAVQVPAGRSEVVFRYSTPGLGLGLVLATTTTLGGAAFIVRSAVRARRTSVIAPRTG